MGQIIIPNRPSGSATRSISAILANFDAILAQANGNLQASSNVKVGVAASTLDGNTNAEGASLSLARADHKHLIQGVERRAADPASGHFVGRVYFNTTSELLMVCTDEATPVYAAVPTLPSLDTQQLLFTGAQALNTTDTLIATVDLTLPAGWVSMDVVIWGHALVAEIVDTATRAQVWLESPDATLLGQKSQMAIAGVGAGFNHGWTLPLAGRVLGISATQALRIEGNVVTGANGDARCDQAYLVAYKIRRS